MGSRAVLWQQHPTWQRRFSTVRSRCIQQRAGCNSLPFCYIAVVAALVLTCKFMYPHGLDAFSNGLQLLQDRAAAPQMQCC
jgi:hypothetical protein